MVDKDRDEERRREDRGWEALKLYFEFFKHFTPLTSAAALLVIALRRELDFGSRAAIAILVILGVNLLITLAGMYVVMFRASDWHYSPRPGWLPFLLMVATIVAFVFGLMGAAVILDDSPCGAVPTDALFGC